MRSAFSHAFGARLLNVAEALKLAANWTNLGTLRSVTDSFVMSEAIPDNDGLIVAWKLAGTELRVEHVEVKINVKHANRGDLRITIISPSGMKSIAQARANDDNADFTDCVFTSVRHWGESSNGEWQVVFEDTVANGVAGRFMNATLTVYGASK